MFFRHGTDKLVYPLLFVTLLFFVSYRPRYHLRKNMPAGFYSDVSTGQKRSMDERTAWAYWESAQMDVQFLYPHGHPLPNDPPPQFHVDTQVFGSEASDPATRKRYWQRLQAIWDTPEAWQAGYEWDWSWVRDPIDSAAQWLRDKARGFL